MLDALTPLIGEEHAFPAVCAELRTAARTSGATAVGAFHVTCSDESEFECTDAFRRDFAQEMLPRLKYGSHVPFRIANPGARYEWGSAAVAQDHFMTAAARRGWLLMVVKINTHVAVMRSGSGGLAFGKMDRYGDASVYCGAIDATLGGSPLPFAGMLADELRSDGLDRLALLRDPEMVPPALAPLYGAVVTARLQARRVVQDVQDAPPKSAFKYLVVHGVTLNRPGMDAELIGGAYLLDRQGPRARDVYVGLGDDPRAYHFDEHGGRIRVVDPSCAKPRPARNHRQLAAERLATMQPALADPRLKQAVGEATRAGGAGQATAAALLKPALLVLAEIAVLPAALFLFAEGLVGVHHAVRLQRAGSDRERAEAARDVMNEFEARLDELTPAQARRLLERLQQATPSDAS